MTTRDELIDIPVDHGHIEGTLVTPGKLVPGVLFIHGWGGSQQQYVARAREVAALGCVSLTFDLRGHARRDAQAATVTREDNLHDVLAAYDRLARQKAIDKSAIAVIGSSYGGYLAAILTSLRPVKWLALRVPALYKDADWKVAKRQLAEKQNLAAFRKAPGRADANKALRACTEFKGDVLIIESEHDDLVPHETIKSYREACANAKSLTYRVIAGADHGITKEPWQRAYTSLLVNWLTEMVFGAREGGLTAQGSARTGAAPQEAPPTKG